MTTRRRAGRPVGAGRPPGRRPRVRSGIAPLACALLMLAPAPAAAQWAGPSSAGPDFLEAPLEPGEPYIVIRLAENRLAVVDGREVLWSAPVATGTGFRLEGAGQDWAFDTPRGVFRIERKETDPVWITPDWAYVERGEPVPPPDSPVRRRPGTLGSTALYIGYELAIHGTDRPELVLDPDPENRRVSHGCIRMTDEDARRLFHSVEVGTLVLIY